MSSPQGSSVDLSPHEQCPGRYKLVSLLVLIVLAIILIIVSIVRNEQKVISLDAQQSLMLKKICEATVSNC